MLEDNSQTDLTERMDRGGKGGVRLSGVDITDESEMEALTLITGEPARFVFRLNQIPKGMVIEYVDFTIYDLQGRAIAYFNSRDRGSQDVEDPSLETKLVCRIEELFLLPGRYRINVGIFGNGEQQDHVEGAAFFNVEEGTVRGRPILFRSNRPGNVVLPHRWTLPGGDKS
jgi:lipopolysaccharide transport system ATP-binding protein